MAKRSAASMVGIFFRGIAVGTLNLTNGVFSLAGRSLSAAAEEMAYRHASSTHGSEGIDIDPVLERIRHPETTNYPQEAKALRRIIKDSIERAPFHDARGHETLKATDALISTVMQAALNVAENTHHNHYLPPPAEGFEIQGLPVVSNHTPSPFVQHRIEQNMARKAEKWKRDNPTYSPEADGFIKHLREHPVNFGKERTFF